MVPVQPETIKLNVHKDYVIMAIKDVVTAYSLKVDDESLYVKRHVFTLTLNHHFLLISMRNQLNL